MNTSTLLLLKDDLRYAWRRLRHDRAFLIAATLLLILGIGPTTAVFSVVNVALIRPMVFRDSNKLVYATEFYPRFHHSLVPAPEFIAWRDNTHSLEQLSAFGIPSGATLVTATGAQHVTIAHVTNNYFRTLGVTPALGRDFIDGDSNQRVAILSSSLRQSVAGKTLDVLNHTVSINDVSYTVIAVLPHAFIDPGTPDADLWVPDAVSTADNEPSGSLKFVSVIGRLKQDLPISTAQAELEKISKTMNDRYPPPWRDYHATAQVHVVSLRRALTEDERPEFFLLVCFVGIILIITVANLANLMLSRSITVHSHIALRAVLGASRQRLSSLLIAESFLITLCGGGLGFVAAAIGVSGLRFLIPAAVSRQIPLDLNVLAFGIVISLFTGIVIAMAPLMSMRRITLSSALRQGASHVSEGRRGLRVRSALVICQLTLSTVLLISSVLLIRTFGKLLAIDPGFDPSNVLIARASLPSKGYDSEQQVAYFRHVIELLASTPGVSSVAAADAPPFATFDSVGTGFQGEGQPPSHDIVGSVRISPDYFHVLQINLIRGRAFTTDDAKGTPLVVIVNSALASDLFNGLNPIGRKLSMNGARGPWMTVVGEVADIRQRKLTDRVWPEVYRPYLQSPVQSMTFLVRTPGDSHLLIPTLSRIAEQVDPNVPLFGVQTLEEELNTSLASEKQRMILSSLFAALAFFVAAVGLYSIVAYAVTKQERAIGIRRALGAKPVHIVMLVLRHGIVMSGIGLVLGASSAIAFMRYIRLWLYGVTPVDPPTYLVVSGLLFGVGLLACYIPARRALRVDPIEAIRSE